ncbi:hypothetical protein WICANDRAFT_82190 [Wickerhamomyces anomalus NRRL Y-366-8]|uniref:Secreted protein n=1 Tax=Wickerhamomyces anomalus (strain ATCC 58044 / CBS 1984 / NCYC 433 / NRRL Y-366-8) TaxID=683960 RepID=A0A1E3P9I8_WICAA|nr:uncharacterized protein WICANDRAFT_82190 [Wickerhamomyces anomalus NRRL Y-366-8]ODQ62076.1 hypothetical protein WICANDRAFT_82190 [Wickerhamomyces anomalus NRRL Y-366-8]
MPLITRLLCCVLILGPGSLSLVVHSHKVVLRVFEQVKNILLINRVAIELTTGSTTKPADKVNVDNGLFIP